MVQGYASGGEANTASNVGSGAGVYKQKVGTDLQFKGIIAGDDLAAVDGASDITLNVESDTAATANKIVKRDGSGRMKAVAGVASDDVVNKAQLDAINTSFGPVVGTFGRGKFN